MLKIIKMQSQFLLCEAMHDLHVCACSTLKMSVYASVCDIILGFKLSSVMLSGKQACGLLIKL